MTKFPTAEIGGFPGLKWETWGTQLLWWGENEEQMRVPFDYAEIRFAQDDRFVVEKDLKMRAENLLVAFA
jgi:hypothetical protein